MKATPTEAPDEAASLTPRQTVQAPFGRWWDRRPGLLRALALTAIAWTAASLVWRLGWSWDGANPLTWTLLLVCELFAAWTLAALTWLSWRVKSPAAPAATPDRSVDVYVCAYDEPESVLRATLTGCRRLTYPHTTYLLDDGRRPQLAALAMELGAYYLTRPDRSHGKAGNINYALGETAGELVLVLDADHVPTPDALDALVGYFDDERVAVVQTPLDYFNSDSQEHYQPGRHEHSVLAEVISPAKDRHGSACWYGSAAMLRREALRSVGGVATETATGDFQTSLRLQAQGWFVRYHNHVVAQGFAPPSLASYLRQRDRRALGDLSVLRTADSPLRAPGLSAAQRLSYLFTLSGYLAGPVRVLLLAVLAVTLWTGALPLGPTHGWPFALLWAPAVALQVLAGSALWRGYLRTGEAFHAELTGAHAHLRALRRVLRPRRPSLRVPRYDDAPPHRRADDDFDLGGLAALRQQRLPVLLGTALAVGLVGRGLDAVDVVAMAELPGFAAWVVPGLALIELRRVCRSLALHARRRQVRAAFRFPVRATAKVGAAFWDGSAGALGVVTDINATGATVTLPRNLPLNSPLRLTFFLPDALGNAHRIDVEAEVRSCRTAEDGFRLGTQFHNVDPTAAQAIVEYCYVVSTFERVRTDYAEVLIPAPRRGRMHVAQLEESAA